MPWYAPVIVAVLGVLTLLASRRAEPWMAASQVRAQQFIGAGEAQPGSWQAWALTFSRKYAEWFLRVAAAYLLVGAVVMAIVITA